MLRNARSCTRLLRRRPGSWRTGRSRGRPGRRATVRPACPNRHAWHHGYATEAARAALAVAFDGIGLNEIWSKAAVLNEPSQAVMRRLELIEIARFSHPGCQ